MIELFYWPTPNGHKITMLLEEANIPYRITRVNLGEGEQFTPDYLRIAPNNCMPAIIDHAPADGGAAVSVFESGAILLYLADKCGQFVSRELRQRTLCVEWLFWQMAGLGPMAGQNHHFNSYAPEKIAYAIERYERETSRLYGVLDQQLKGREFICGDAYSIADMACYPWIVPHKLQNQNLDDFIELKRWFAAIRARAATIRAYAQGAFYQQPVQIPEQARKILFERGKKT